MDRTNILGRTAASASMGREELTTKQQAHLIELHETGEYSKRDLAELFTVARSTVYRTITRAEQHMAPAS